MVGDKPGSGVLVVDDDENACLLLAELIQLVLPQTAVWTAYDGAGAITLASKHRPRAAVVDLEMPGLDGAAAATAIRAALGADAPLLIAVSGNPARLDDPATADLFDHRFLKPIAVDALMELLGIEPPDRGDGDRAPALPSRGINPKLA